MGIMESLKDFSKGLRDTFKKNNSMDIIDGIYTAFGEEAKNMVSKDDTKENKNLDDRESR